MQALRHPARLLSIFALVLSAALLGNAGMAAAADPLLCFDGTTDGVTYGGHCTLNPSGTGATLDNSVAVGSGDYSGVYFATSSLSGKPLSQVSDLSFTYSGTPTAGSPRISLPIDTNGNGTTDFYAFIGATYCNDGAGLVDPLHDTTCTIFYTDGPVAGEANWAAFVAAHPTWRVGSSVPFVVADDAGLWTVSNVHLGAAVPVATDKDKDDKDKDDKDKDKDKDNEDGQGQGQQGQQGQGQGQLRQHR